MAVTRKSRADFKSDEIYNLNYSVENLQLAIEGAGGFDPRGANSAVTKHTISDALAVVVAASAATRKKLSIFNDSENVLCIKKGAGASGTDLTAKVQPGGMYEDAVYTGAVTAILLLNEGEEAAEGDVYVTIITT